MRNDRRQRINRIRRWDVIQATTLHVGGSIPVVAPKVTATPTTFAARLYLDISTDEDQTVVLGRDELPRIFEELRGYAMDIADKGDHK